MARVPIDNLPGVAPDGLPGARISPNAPEAAFGGGQDAAQSFGQARGLANDIAREQDEIRQKADLAAVFKATAELSDYSNDVQYNPQTGIVAQKGDRAFPLAKSVPEGFRKKVSELTGSLSSPEQRQIFQRQADQHWNSLNSFNQRHIAGQSEQFMAQQADAYVASRQNAGALAGSALDLDGVESAARDVDQARRAWALKNGVSRDAADLIISQDTSKVYAGAIGAMLDAKNDRAAKEAFAKYSGMMTANDIKHLKPIIERETTLGESFRLADVVLSYEPATLQDAMTHLDKIVEGDKISPEIRQEASRVTAQRFAVMKEARREAYQNDLQEAANVIEAKADLSEIPVELRSRLHRTDLAALDTRAAQIRRKQEPVTDWKKYTTLKDMASDPERRKDFLDTPPMSYRPYLSDSEFKEVANLRAGLLKGDEKTKKQIDGYRTINTIVSSTLDLNGFKERDNPEQRETIEQLMDEEVKYFRAANSGKDPSNEEVKKMITKLTTQAAIEERSFLPNKKEYGFQTTKRYLDTADAEIPQDERTKIEAALQRGGVEPTRRRILEVWLEKKARAPYERLLPK